MSGNPVPDIKSVYDISQYADRIKNGTVWIEQKIRDGWSAYALVPRGEEERYIEWEQEHNGVILRVAP